ncbi:MAG: glycosyl transferase [Alphaproteobacteria bacterium]|nr:MAG: glycosyl transferase [Alphaproteobacteria bacterium]
MYKLLALAPNPWNGMWMNRQQLLSRLGASRPVLYSSGVWDSWQVPSQAWIKSPLVGRTERDCNVDVDVPGSFEIRWHAFPPLDRIVTKHAGRRWRRALDRFDGPLIAHLFYPSYIDYLDGISPDALVYHAYDLYSSQSGWTPELAAMERELLARADAVIASSDDQAEYLEKVGGKPVHRLYNAVDYSAFSTAVAEPVPEEVAAIPRPRIGYVGRINKKVDLPLLAELSRRHPEWHLVMVGPVHDLDSECQAALDDMRRLPNVHFLGSKEQRSLGRYMAANDVNLMCYRIDRGWIRYAYPLKMQEYLATGVPVVSSNLRSVQEFREVIDVAVTVEDWEATVARALQDRSDASRRARQAIAANNDWSARVEQLDAILLGVASRVRGVRQAELGKADRPSGRVEDAGV